MMVSQCLCFFHMSKQTLGFMLSLDVYTLHVFYHALRKLVPKSPCDLFYLAARKKSPWGK